VYESRGRIDLILHGIALHCITWLWALVTALVHWEARARCRYQE
jgi:hypothetical protein